MSGGDDHMQKLHACNVVSQDVYLIKIPLRSLVIVFFSFPFLNDSMEPSNTTLSLLPAGRDSVLSDEAGDGAIRQIILSFVMTMLDR